MKKMMKTLTLALLVLALLTGTVAMTASAESIGTPDVIYVDIAAADVPMDAMRAEYTSDAYGNNYIDGDFPLTLVEGETTIYSVTVPEGAVKMYFAFDYMGQYYTQWQTVPTDGTNLFTMSGEKVSGRYTGTWRKFVPYDASAFTQVTKPGQPYSGTPVTPAKITSSNYALYGFTADNWSAYDGYYAISTAEELYGWASTKGNAVLINDIVINEDVHNSDASALHQWNSVDNFNNIFDGRGHSISGVYANGNNTTYPMLFGRISADGTVKNVVIKNSLFVGSSGNYTRTATIAYSVYGTLSNVLIAEDVKVEGYATTTGLAGYTEDSSVITNCVSLAYVEAAASSRYVGALFVSKDNNILPGTVTNCYYISGRTTMKGNARSAVGYNQTSFDTSGAKGLSSTSASHTCIAMEHPAATASCHAQGSTAYSDCMICGKILSGTKSVTEVSHQWQAATCMAPKLCTLCGGAEGDRDVDNHTFDETGYCSPCATQAAATVNGEFYLSIDEAFTKANATNNATLVLLDDVVIADAEITGTFTLDLNGFTLKSADNYAYALYITAGHLTIQDSVGTGRFIENGKGDDAVGAWDNGSVTIYGGNFGEVNLQGNGKFEIYGGKFDYFYAPSDNISIYSGEFTEIRGNGKLVWNFLSPDGFYYDADGNLLDARESKSLNNVTVKQGADLSNAVVTVNGTYAYIGAECKPDITVTVYDKVIDPAHYTITYANNTNIGTEAAVTVTGKDPYSGSQSATFEITKGTLAIQTAPETTFEFGDTYVGKAITGGKVVIVGNESAVITGIWTWVEGTDTAAFTPDAQYTDLFETFTETIQVTQKVTAATPILTLTTPSPSMGPGQTIRMGVVAVNPYNAELTDLPTAFRITYQIGEGGTPVTVDGLEFTLPSNVTLGESVYVWVKNVAVEGKYAISTSNTVTLFVGQVDYSEQIKAVEEAIAALEQKHGADVTELREELAALAEAYKKADELLKQELDASLSALADRVKALEETYATKAQLEEAVKALNEAIAEGDKTNADALAEAVATLEKALTDAVAALEKTDETNRTELETLISEAKTALETAIAELENRVEQNEAQIAALQTALAEAIENLNKAIAEGDQANADALAEAVATLEKALTDAVAALEKADATNRAELEALISEAKTTLEAALDEAIGKLEKADADNKAQLETLINTVKAALETVIAALEGRVSQNESDIAALQEDLKQAIVDLNEAIASGDAELNKKITNLRSALNSAIAAYMAADDAMKAELTTKIEQADAALQAAIDKLTQDLASAEEELRAAIASGDAELAEKITKLNTALDQAIVAYQAADETVKAELTTKIEQADAALQAAIGKLTQDLASAKEELGAAILAGDTALDEKIAALTTALDNVTIAYKAVDETMKAELSTKIEEADAALQAAIDKLTQDLIAAKEELNAAIASGDADLDGKIAALSTALDNAIAAYQAADAAQNTELTDYMKESVTSLDTAIKQVQKNLDDVKAELAAKDSQIERLAIIACVISSVALCGSGAFVVWFFIDRKKRS